MKPWYDRVVDRIAELDALVTSDEATLRALVQIIDTPRAREAHTRVIRNDEGGATVLYRNKVVFSLGVHESMVTVRAATGKITSFTNHGQALDETIDVMARHVRSAPTDEDDDRCEPPGPSVAEGYFS